MEFPFSLGCFMEITRVFTEEDVAGFADIMKDKNIVHNQKLVTHELLNTFIVASLSTSMFAEPKYSVVQQEVIYLKPVYPGDTITARAVITNYDADTGWITLATSVRNHAGEGVLAGQMVVNYVPITL
ncbi:MaoC/PaaZ C-terminal domain-containing protein [Aneurinibacillus tyrosinisolvens]|uniref:MaoC/PaaZ C-terminal domain-containing protein n=1 Tax=Aneurinibacillus tyrosinisolvens TaxID=1443435 RepID=UPI00063EE7C0|nr:MaoC/PaaZ C-terminal domain-containing protein [Aneurinibacillus tyrosinisolvens]